MAASNTGDDTTTIPALVRTAGALLTAALQPSSRKVYAQALTKYEQFARGKMGIQAWFPASVNYVALYIAHLINNGYAASTVATNLSALAYFHNLTDSVDPTCHFVIRKIMAGANKLVKSSDMRLPITLDMLRKLIDSTQHVTRSFYEAAMLKAMFILMFHAFMRIGEVTKSPNNIQFSEVVVNLTSVTITFTRFKHHRGHPMVLTIPASDSAYCPVKLTLAYLNLRGSSPGPFFCYPGPIPVVPQQFSSMLSCSLSWANLQKINIKPHSFRIGAATWAAINGFTDSQIQTMGRWSSSAFRKYIRINSFRVAL